VGSAAQTKAMKKVAGSIKLELAQYREMAAFAQFASDLDVSTQRLLARGERLTELLKQGQFQPMPVSEQVASLYAGVNGYLDGIPPAAVTRYEQELLDAIREKGADILSEIETSGVLSAENEAKLKTFLEDFTKTFAA
jgi:F-type H+-transporting ATPase subunit alpha